MKTGITFSSTEHELMQSVLNELSDEVTRLTGVNPARQGGMKRRFSFGKDEIFRDVRFGFSVSREGILEFGIEARLSKPCDKPECFMDRLSEIFDSKDEIQFKLPDIVRVNYAFCIDIDDRDFERMLSCIKDNVMEKFTSIYILSQNS